MKRTLMVQGFPEHLKFVLSKDLQDHLKRGGQINIRCNGDGRIFVAEKKEAA